MRNELPPEGVALGESIRLALPSMFINLTAEQHASDGTAIVWSGLGNARKSVGLLEPIHIVVMTVGMREWLVAQLM